MSYTTLSADPVRVLLFKHHLVDALHVCLAIDMSPLWCDVRVLEESATAIESACATVRSGAVAPGLVLFDCELRDSASVGILILVRKAPELRRIPLLVIGDGDDPELERVAHRSEADGFIRRPSHSRDLSRTGRDIADFWTSRRRRTA